MTAVRLIQTVLEGFIKEGGFDRHCNRVKILTGGNGALTATMKIEKQDTNRGGFLHGGMSALLVDSLSSVALMTHLKCTNPGVSVVINMTYLKAVPIGQEILIKSSVDKVGNRLAFLTVEILNNSTNELVVKGSHTKFIG